MPRTLREAGGLRRLVATAAMVVAIIGGGALRSAWAADDRDGREIVHVHVVSGTDRSGFAPRAGNVTGMRCFFYVVEADGRVGVEVAAPDLATGSAYYRECRWTLPGGGLGGLTGDQGIYMKAPGGWAPLGEGDLLQILLARVAPPDPVPVVSPPADSLIAGVPTRLALEGALEPLTVTDDIAGIATGTITATPVEATWRTGDPDASPVVCELGRDTACEYTYGTDSSTAESGAWPSSVAVRYRVEWVIDDRGARSSGVLEDVVAVTDFDVTVTEIEAVLR